MPYTEFKFEQGAVADRMATVLRNVAKNTGDENNALSVAVSSIMKRFAMHGKVRYTDYGPYWFALKDVLKRNGKDLGDYTDNEIASAYCGSSNFETIILADMFRDYNLGVNPVGTIKFHLDGYTGDYWVLHDPDMLLP